MATSHARAGTSWGGSINLTSDYLVRGISRTNNQAALQLDLHLATDSGLITGIFLSNSQAESDQSRDVELDGFLGYAWSAGTDFRGNFRVTYYSYPWNRAGSAYNYTEFDADVVYRDSLELAVIYSPDQPRYVPFRASASSSSTSIEANYQHSVYRKLSGLAGVGYSELNGPYSGGYAFWSAGAAYDLGYAAVTLLYEDTSGAAKSLFYKKDSPPRWLASVIYRF